MADNIPREQQMKNPNSKPIFKARRIMWIRLQNKTYDELRKNPKLKNVKDLPSTDEDIASIKRLTKKLGSDSDHSEIIDLVDADYLTFRKTMTQAEGWLLDASPEEKRCLFFYYTGHGFQHNWTQAGLNHETEYKFNMEEKLNALSKTPDCFVVAIFDCCREDISHLEKNFAHESDGSACHGSFLVLYGCETNGTRSADNLMAEKLEARIEQAVRESGDGTNFLMHKVFEDFYINDKFCPDYRRMNAHLLLEYRSDGKGFTTVNAVSAQPAAQEPEETKEPATTNQPARQAPQVVTSSSAQAQGNLPVVQEEIKQQPEVVVINGKEYSMDVKKLNLYYLSKNGVTGDKVWP